MNDTDYGDLPCGCVGHCECGAEEVQVGELGGHALKREAAAKDKRIAALALT